MSEAADVVVKLMDEISKNLYDAADKFNKSHIVKVNDLDEMQKALDGGNFCDAYWCGDEGCEAEIKQKYAATTRVFHKDQSDAGEHKCVCCGKKSKHRIYFARAY